MSVLERERELSAAKRLSDEHEDKLTKECERLRRENSDLEIALSKEQVFIANILKLIHFITFIYTCKYFIFNCHHYCANLILYVFNMFIYKFIYIYIFGSGSC